jgi:hypothetical protein
LEPEIRAAAVRFLRKKFGKGMRQLLRKAIEENPQHWWVSRHRGWGTRVRNELRSAGHGEEDLGIENLDDVYIGLIEEAVKE